MIGSCLIKHWASTQKAVTLSSGEAELGGVVRGTCEGLGLASLGRDLGISLALDVFTDSSAAIGICRRSGIGKIRHLAVGQLWAQERLRQGEFRLHKVPGMWNPADLCTKPMTAEEILRHSATLCIAKTSGRAVTAPELQKTDVSAW